MLITTGEEENVIDVVDGGHTVFAERITNITSAEDVIPKDDGFANDIATKQKL